MYAPIFHIQLGLNWKYFYLQKKLNIMLQESNLMLSKSTEEDGKVKNNFKLYAYGQIVDRFSNKDLVQVLFVCWFVNKTYPTDS